MRWVALLATLVLAAPAAHAQVFKPKGKAASTEKKPAKTSRTTAKKAPAKAAKKKSSTKKSAAVDRGRPADLTPEPAARQDDSDFVKIWDDDEIE